MSRTFMIQRSNNKIKKWSVKEDLSPIANTPNEEEKKEEEKIEEEKIEEKEKTEEPKKKRGRPAFKPKVEKKKHSKMIYFGQSGYRDYVLMNEKIDGDEEKQKEAEHIKAIYIKRHQRNEDWTDLYKAGTWARYILWNMPTMEESIKDMEERFNINIILDKTPITPKEKKGEEKKDE